jgi:hypothetical protein
VVFFLYYILLRDPQNDLVLPYDRSDPPAGIISSPRQHLPFSDDRSDPGAADPPAGIIF